MKAIIWMVYKFEDGWVTWVRGRWDTWDLKRACKEHGKLLEKQIVRRQG